MYKFSGLNVERVESLSQNFIILMVGSPSDTKWGLGSIPRFPSSVFSLKGEFVFCTIARIGIFKCTDKILYVPERRYNQMFTLCLETVEWAQSGQVESKQGKKKKGPGCPGLNPDHSAIASIIQE